MYNNYRINLEEVPSQCSHSRGFSCIRICMYCTYVLPPTSLIVSEALINLAWFSYTRYCILLSSSCISENQIPPLTTRISLSLSLSLSNVYTFLHAFLLLIEFTQGALFEYLIHEKRRLEAGLVNVHRIILLLKSTHTLAMHSL